MKFIIDIDESRVYKYGAIVIENISPDVDVRPLVITPCFKFPKINQGLPPIINVTLVYGDERDAILGERLSKINHLVKSGKLKLFDEGEKDAEQNAESEGSGEPAVDIEGSGNGNGDGSKENTDSKADNR